MSRRDFALEWWEEKYNKKAIHAGKQTKAFIEWLEVQKTAYGKILDERYKKKVETAEFEEKMECWRDSIGDWFDNLRNSITSWKTLIKWTKRFVGLLITAAGLFCTYFVVNFLGRGILYIVEHWDWTIVLYVFVAIGCLVVIVGIFMLLKAWVDYIAEKKLKIWYVKIIYYLLYWVVFIPLKLIFYYFLWQLILLNLWALVSAGAVILWSSFLGFLGIFGEYFGASYTDYCPGIEWVSPKKKK